jgi:hypothetical protein
MTGPATGSGREDIVTITALAARLPGSQSLLTRVLAAPSGAGYRGGDKGVIIIALLAAMAAGLGVIAYLIWRGQAHRARRHAGDFDD